MTQQLAAKRPTATQRAALQHAIDRGDGTIITTDRTLGPLVGNGWAEDPRYAYGRGRARATITNSGRAAVGDDVR